MLEIESLRDLLQGGGGGMIGGEEENLEIKFLDPWWLGSLLKILVFSFYSISGVFTTFGERNLVILAG